MISRKSAAVGLLVSAVCLYLAVRQVDLGETGAALLAARPAPLLLAAVLLLVAVAVRCWRWQLLFLPADRVTFAGTVAATFIGYLVNSVLPGRLGEFVRAYLISETDGVATGRALGTIFVEKLLDILILLLLLGVVALQMPLPAWAATSASTVAALFVLATLGFFLLARIRRPLVAWVEARLDSMPGLRRLHPSHFVDAGLSAADGVSRPAPLLAQLVISVALWGIAVGILYAAMSAFRLSLPVTAAVLVLVATNLGMTVPSAPAYVGVYHLLATESLKLFGVDQSVALSYAVVVHSLSFGIFIVGGVFYMWRRNYVFGDLWQRTARSKITRASPAHQAP